MRGCFMHVSLVLICCHWLGNVQWFMSDLTFPNFCKYMFKFRGYGSHHSVIVKMIQILFFPSKQWCSTHKNTLCTSKIHVYDVLHAQYATIGVFLWSCNPGPLLEELALDSLELTILRYFYAWMYWSMYCRLKESLSTTIHCAPKPAAWRPF